MNSSAEFSIGHAFVLDPTVSGKIWGLLDARVGNVYAAAACNDDLVRRFESKQQLDEYENPVNRGIYALSYYARSRGSDTSAEVRFNLARNQIKVEISGAESTVLEVRDRLHEIIAGAKPWYWRIAKFDAYFWFFLFAFFGGFVIGVMGSGTKNEPLSFKFALLGAVVLLLFIGAISLVPWSLNRLRERFFPFAVYAIGQGKIRYDNDEKLRWGVIVAFIISLLSSIVAAIRIQGS